MEKNGRIVLTSTEASSFRSTGVVPERIRNSWGLTSEELSEHLQSGFAEVIDNKTNNGESL